MNSISEKTAEGNFERAKQALGVLLDIDPEIYFQIQPDGSTTFENDGGKVEFYRSW